MKPIISYVRVSKERQGRSGLGIEAQQFANRNFCAAEGFEVAREFIEVETGKGADALERRPQLAAAFVAAGELKCAVLVAKLDRLTRNVYFGAGLLHRGVAFRIADMPSADNFMIQIMLAVAEKERDMIAKRTKEALAAAKARGKVLGNPQEVQTAALRAIAFAETLRATVAPVMDQSSRRIADYLNTQGVKTAEGCAWQSKNVIRLLDRLRRENVEA